ncbi:uncharacterized protein PHACADRAFT_206408 [Phanerochaete carnosa HHB-10118-sp]|uniref:Uncharacterized protein n=1 Tax=Phanerochaete carnosa (strain HHB-10118-sp) TaxID=650164 RepID=K5W0Z3_PHACS|nr:uncharacterized protein PHACADRAFT_206408 [Phanerochaete carnosa HHB-10118-sp]EKM57508.1 hypothetical protein PHACADRAFT_206408 [Phanerochaete carnosa HHB-10118-sp]
MKNNQRPRDKGRRVRFDPGTKEDVPEKDNHHSPSSSRGQLQGVGGQEAPKGKPAPNRRSSEVSHSHRQEEVDSRDPGACYGDDLKQTGLHVLTEQPSVPPVKLPSVSTEVSVPVIEAVTLASISFSSAQTPSQLSRSPECDGASEVIVSLPVSNAAPTPTSGAVCSNTDVEAAQTPLTTSQPMQPFSISYEQAALPALSAFHPQAQFAVASYFAKTPLWQSPSAQTVMMNEYTPFVSFDSYSTMGVTDSVFDQSAPQINLIVPQLEADLGVSASFRPEAGSPVWQASLSDARSFSVQGDAYGSIDEYASACAQGAFPQPAQEFAVAQSRPEADAQPAAFDPGMPASLLDASCAAQGAPLESQSSWYEGVETQNIFRAEDLSTPNVSSPQVPSGVFDDPVTFMVDADRLSLEAMAQFVDTLTAEELQQLGDAMRQALGVQQVSGPYADYELAFSLLVRRVGQTDDGMSIWSMVLSEGVLEWLAMSLAGGVPQEKDVALLQALPESMQVAISLGDSAAYKQLIEETQEASWVYGSATTAGITLFSSNIPDTTSSAGTLAQLYSPEGADDQEGLTQENIVGMSPTVSDPVEPAESVEDSPSANITPERVEDSSCENGIPKLTLDDITVEVIEAYVRLEYIHCTQSEIFVVADAQFPGDGLQLVKVVEPEAVRRLLCVQEAERLMREAILQVKAQGISASVQSGSTASTPSSSRLPSTPSLSRTLTASQALFAPLTTPDQTEVP